MLATSYDCLSGTTLSLFLDKRLSAAETTGLERHIDHCPTCRQVLAELARGSSRPLGTPSAATAARTLEAGDRVDRYVVRGVLGTGAMGTVYAAFDPDLDRQLALKVLRPDAANAVASTRLLREAQTLAHVSHPNVVGVYDVGVFGEQIYIGMELLAGGTLTSWLAERPRTWREIVAMFVAAGRGLAAVHEHGIVHRDFKPDNVLIDRDRARIGDFGLALAGATVAAGEISSRSPVDGSLTATGALVGTPAYMAPEQFDGQPADARSDQFSFAVALHAALYGERPFAGLTIAELRDAMARGEVRPPPPGHGVPMWLRRIVVRSLALDPAKRFPTMSSLVHALERTPAVRAGRRIALGAALTLGATLAVGWSTASRAEAPCTGGDRELAGIWNLSRRTQLWAGFTATGVPWAGDAAGTTVAFLDRYTHDWVAAHRAACVATRIDQSQSEAVLDLRMACLRQRRASLRALTDQLMRPDVLVIDQAAFAAASLKDVVRCEDVTALQQVMPMPTDPQQRAEIARLEDRLAELETRRSVARATELVPQTTELVRAATSTGYAPLEARALDVHGIELQRDGKVREAADAFRAAISAADRGGDDDRRFVAYTDLIDLLLVRLDRVSDAAELLPLAEAARMRSHVPELDRLWLRTQARVLEAQDRPREAVAKLHELIALQERTLGHDHPEVAEDWAFIAKCLAHYAPPEEVNDAARRSAEMMTRLVGSRSTSLETRVDAARSRLFGGMMLLQQGKPAEALARIEPGARELTDLLGADHSDLGQAINMLGMAYEDLYRLDDAEAQYLHSLAIFRGANGPHSEQFAIATRQLGRIEFRRGAYERALALHREALAIEETLADHAGVGPVLLAVARDLLALARPREAKVAVDRALTMATDKKWYSGALGTSGEIQVALGERAAGIATIRRALSLHTDAHGDQASAAHLRIALARILLTTNRLEAKTLAELAAASFTQLGDETQAAAARAVVDRAR